MNDEWNKNIRHTQTLIETKCTIWTFPPCDFLSIEAQFTRVKLNGQFAPPNKKKTKKKEQNQWLHVNWKCIESDETRMKN